MKTVRLLIIVCGVSACQTPGIEHTYTGSYAWGPEVHSFKPCDSGDNYWVSFDWAGISMRQFYEKNQSRPYQPMYIEFRGQVLQEKVDGFASDYAGLIRISEVFNYSFSLPEHCN